MRVATLLDRLKVILLYSAKLFSFRETFSYSDEILYSENLFYIQGKFLMFRKKIIFKETFFIFRENFYIQGKFWYSEKKCILSENREFKFQTGWDSRISVLDIFDIKKINWRNDWKLIDQILQCLHQTKDLLEDQRAYSLKNLQNQPPEVFCKKSVLRNFA